MFELETLDPVEYRLKTRKSTFVLTALFAFLALVLSTLLVQLLGASDGNNFTWNLTGVLLGLLFTFLLVKYKLQHLPFMREAVYSWQLKRCLMRITNLMHLVRAQALEGQAHAIQLLYFYYQGVDQMHQLEGNDSAALEMLAEKQAITLQMKATRLPLNPVRFDPEWLRLL